MNKRIIFIGFSHRNAKDSRLFYREMRILKENAQASELYLARDGDLYSYNYLKNCRWMHDFNNIINEKNKINRILKKINKKIIGWIIKKINKVKLLKKIYFLNPHVMQASDVREIPFAIIVKFLCNCRIIYDSHEDYFRQLVDYKKRRPDKYLIASLLKMYELFGIRFFEAVFCTDESLEKKYKKSYYKAKRVELLRNFPYITNDLPRNISSNYSNKSLKLVYIGGVNKYRGVIETAEYVARYNKENISQKKLDFYVYSSRNYLVDELARKGLIKHYPYVDFELLKTELVKFDIGICLWLDIPKFRKNLPLKNFDYMAAGLPIITSNFGNLQIHAQRSGAAICINPKDYKEFCSAIDYLFDKKVRDHLGNAGRRYVETEASFQIEASNYIEVILNC